MVSHNDDAFRYKPTEPKDPVYALAYRLWSATPAEVQDSGMTRTQWYAERIRELITAAWQPWDTAPRDGSYFDAWVEPNSRFEKARRIPHVQFCTIGDGFWAHEHGTIDVDDLESLGKPTHWRPEPEGPKK